MELFLTFCADSRRMIAKVNDDTEVLDNCHKKYEANHRQHRGRCSYAKQNALWY